MKFMKHPCVIGCILTLVALLFVSYFFGFTGFRTLALFVLVYFVPIHVMLSRFAFTPGENVMFSFALSAAIVPTIVYYLGFLVGIRKAIWMGFIVLLVVAFLVSKKKLKKEMKEIVDEGVRDVESVVKEEVKEIKKEINTAKQEVEKVIEEIKKEEKN